MTTKILKKSENFSVLCFRSLSGIEVDDNTDQMDEAAQLRQAIMLSLQEVLDLKIPSTLDFSRHYKDYRDLPAS